MVPQDSCCCRWNKKVTLFDVRPNSSSDNMANRSALLKVVLLGDGGVGKSSLMNRYVSNTFDAHSFHTIGVEFLNKELVVDGKHVTMQIWDTAGQERFRSLRTPFYRGADCCMLTFAVDDPHSFHSLDCWRYEFNRYADVTCPDSFPFVLLGNKVDVARREVSTGEARAWCEAHGAMPYFETSAKDASNVGTAFAEAARSALRRASASPVLGPPPDVLRLHVPPSQHSSHSSCC